MRILKVNVLILQLNPNLALPPGAKGWRSEFRRLHWSAPLVPAEELSDHSLEVTGVAFSNADGELLATCGKDNQLFVYRTGPPCRMIFSYCFDFMGWFSAEKCAFNNTGSKLMVAGVLAMDIMARAKGEIVVFDVKDEFEICAR